MNKKIFILFSSIIIITIIVFLGYITKNRKEYIIDEFKSKCNFSSEKLYLEECLANSINKPFDEFIKCIKDKGVSRKVVKNFNILYYLDLIKNQDCNKISSLIDNIINN
jgi:hypothetical protein